MERFYVMSFRLASVWTHYVMDSRTGKGVEWFYTRSMARTSCRMHNEPAYALLVGENVGVERCV